MTSARVKDFQNRAKTSKGRYQLITLRNGELDAMAANGALYQKDRRRKKVYQAWEENWTWVKEINEVLGISGIDRLHNRDAWQIAHQLNNGEN